MKEIMITGAFGQVGKALSRLLSFNFKITKTDLIIPKAESGLILDVTNLMLCREVIDIVKPDVIVNLASKTDVDACEANTELAFSINVGGVKNLMSIFSGPIIHLSTDYVFNGDNGPYSEDDATDPINVYGFSKLASEKTVLNGHNNNLVIRTNVVYDYCVGTQASFLNWVVNSLREGKEINVVKDQWNNPTWTDSLAVVVKRAIDSGLTGIAHWGDGDWISRFDFALKIANIFELDKKLIKPINTDELRQVAPRPLKGGLKTDYVQKALNLEPPPLEESLKAIKARLES